MTAQSKSNPTYTSQKSPVEHDVEVLYQKLGDRWFAFSIIEDDVFMAPVTDETIHAINQERTHLPEV